MSIEVETLVNASSQPAGKKECHPTPEKAVPILAHFEKIVSKLAAIFSANFQLKLIFGNIRQGPMQILVQCDILQRQTDH